MKKSFKIASAAVLTSVFALTLTFCGSKPAETSETTVDTVATETVAPVVADTTTTAADTTTSAQ